MIVDIPALKKELKDQKKTDAEYSEALGVNPSTLWRLYKSGGKKMTVGQMRKTVEFLSLPHDKAIQIFLPEYSQ
ncbi:MAG: hypothetical protein J6J07_01090 [Oscillospiraceae bacterium]|nr:hypothetical protein [Oscillospiraceae bacterium]